jgi:hypothetical protein
VECVPGSVDRTDTLAVLHVAADTVLDIQELFEPWGICSEHVRFRLRECLGGR